MAAGRRRGRFIWPRRAHTERRLYPRVTIAFPVAVTLSEGEPAQVVTGLDLGLGGLRVVLDRYLELFTRFPVELELPVEGRDGAISVTPIVANVALVRIEPDEETPACAGYEASLAFIRLTPDQERLLGLFLLQRLQHDPDTDLVR